jgi:hypothetical protein
MELLILCRATQLRHACLDIRCATENYKSGNSTMPCSIFSPRYFDFMTLDQWTCGCAGGDVKKLDFRFFAGNKKIGAPFHGLKAFFTTGQLNVLDKVVTEVALLECFLEASLLAFNLVCIYRLHVCNCMLWCCKLLVSEDHN